MIYLTGDTHGDIRRFKTFAARRLKAKDVLIICGDFGFVWDGSKGEENLLNWLGKRKYTILFLDGKHENYELLRKYPETELFGGKVQHISGNLYHLTRGEIYEIDGKKVFVFGGGESTEKQFRIDEEHWWEEELPTHTEMDFAKKKLLEAGNKVDYIVTHEAPPSAKGLKFGHRDSTNILDSFFEDIARSVSFDHWFFGSVHQDKRISHKLTALFTDIVSSEFFLI